MPPRKKAEEKLPAKQEAAALPDQWGGTEGDDGFEGATQEEILIPFVSLTQALSASVEAGLAAVGELFIKSLEMSWPEADFIPVARKHVFCEWIPQDRGGGLVDIFLPDDPKVREAIIANKGETFGLQVDDGKGEKNDLLSTFHLYSLFMPDDEEIIQAIIPFASSKLTPYRTFFNSAQNLKVKTDDGKLRRCPLWSHIWHLGVKDEISKSTGRKFKNFHIHLKENSREQAMLAPEDVRLAQAVEFRKMIMENMVKADTQTVDAEKEEDVI